MAFEAGTLVARLRLDLTGFTDGINQAFKDTDALRDSLERAGNAMQRAALTAGAAFTALSGGIAASVAVGSQFEFQIARISSVTGQTGEELDKLREIALQMGRDTLFSASQAADAIQELGARGIETAEDVSKILAPALALATGQGIEMAASITAIKGNLDAFGEELDQAARFADVFAQAANVSNLTVHSLTEALTPVAPLAGALGASLEDVSAILGVLADRNFEAQEAGTALRNIMLELINPTAKAKEILKKYGLTVKEIQSLLPKPIELIKRLGAANISTADAAQLFEKRATAAFLALRDGLPSLNRVRDGLNQQGAAALAAERVMESFTAQMTILKNNVIDLGLAIFHALAPALLPLIDGLTDGIKVVASFVREHESLVRVLGLGATAIAGIATAVFGFGAALASVGLTITGMKVGMAGLASAFPGLIGHLNMASVASVGLKLGLAGIAFTVGFALGPAIEKFIDFILPGFSQGLDELASKLGDSLAKMTEGKMNVKEFAKETLIASEEIQRALANAAKPGADMALQLSKVNDAIHLYNMSLPEGSAGTLKLVDSFAGAETAVKLLELRFDALATKSKTTTGALKAQTTATNDLAAANLATSEALAIPEAELQRQRGAQFDLFVKQSQATTDAHKTFIEQIGQAISLESTLGTAIDGILAGTQGLSNSVGAFIKSLGQAILKALILKGIMLLISSLIPGGSFFGKILGLGGKKEGGLIGAANGFMPRGEDTIIAVQEGEGVITRDAVKQIGGAAGIAAINRGQGAGGVRIVMNNKIDAPFGITHEQLDRFQGMLDQLGIKFAPAGA